MKSYRRPRKKAIKVSKVYPRINKFATGAVVPNTGMWARQPYNESVTSTSGTSTNNSYVWSANGCYDPNVTSGVAGHQPIGFDQMMLFYEHYTCVKCAVQCNIVNTGSVGCYVGIMVAPSDTQVSNIELLNENGNMVKKWINPGTAGTGSNAGTNYCSLSLEVSIPRMNGRKKIIGDDLFRGDSASNPTEQTYIHVFCYNPLSATQATIAIEFRADYTVKYTEPRKLIQS